MIHKCPHCKNDVIFSREVCPACGYRSAEHERLESTYVGDEAKLGFVPAYTRDIEEQMNETQKRGRVVLSLVIGMILAPQIVFNVVLGFWLSVSFKGLLALAVTTWLTRKLWFGFRWTKAVITYAVGFTGLAGIVILLLRFSALNPVAKLACGVFGVVYLWCAWQLLQSKDIPEFMTVQRSVERY